MRLRLALWYGGLTGLVVLLVALLLYALQSRAHYDQLDQALINAAMHTSAELAESRSPADFADIIAKPQSSDVALRIYGADDQVLAVSPKRRICTGPRPASHHR